MGLYPSLLMQNGLTRRLVGSKFIVLSGYEAKEAMFASQFELFYILLNMVVFRPKKVRNRGRGHIFPLKRYLMFYFRSRLAKLLP